jgi:hypothetical protein
MPLHQNLKGMDSKGVLTGVELSLAELRGGRKGNNVEGVRDRVLLQHSKRKT